MGSPSKVIVGTAIIAITTPTYMRDTPDSVSAICVGVGVVVTIGFGADVEVAGVIGGFGEEVGVEVEAVAGVGVAVGLAAGVELGVGSGVGEVVGVGVGVVVGVGVGAAIGVGVGVVVGVLGLVKE